MKAIILARVSTQEQKEAGNSLPAQHARLIVHIEKSYSKTTNSKLVLDKEFVFDESAYKEHRKEFDKIIDYINKQKETIAFCCDKVDRLSRDFLIGLPALERLRREGKIELHFPGDGLVLHQNSPATDLFHFNIALALAQYYSNAISDNTKRAFEQKRRNGEWTGRVRLGYLNVPLDVENRTRKDIIVDPLRGFLVAEMFQMYATGNYSLETIRIAMTEKGLRTLKGGILTKSTVENILKDSFFCGIAMSKKYGSYLHNHPRLIDRETFDKCQQVRGKRKKSPNKEKSKDFIFKNIFKCHNCGCAITAEQVKKKNGDTYNYYSCTNGKKICERVYVTEKELLEPVYGILERLESIPADVQDKLVERLKELNDSEVKYHDNQINRIQAEHKKLQDNKNSLLNKYIEESITKSDYDKKMQEYNDKFQLLEIESSEYTKADTDYKTTISTVFALARRAREIFDSSEVHEKRQILNYLLQNSTLNRKTPCITMRSPFNLILDLSYRPIGLRE